MKASLQLAIAQTTSSNSHAENIAMLDEIVATAISQNAEMIALPEAVGLMNRDREMALKQVVDADDDPYLAACCAHAVRHAIWIQAGSTPVLDGGGKFFNHGTMINPSGEIIATYNKLHLFDIFLEGKPPTGESNRYSAGDRAVVIDTPWGPFGLTICYDLRFPYLYRDMAKAGAVLAFIPSAFTVPTGKAHWETLLRARAIENGMWIVAAAQVGSHADGRRTWGHSLIISPWGEVVEDLGGDVTQTMTVEIDLEKSQSARTQIPSLQADPNYQLDIIKQISPLQKSQTDQNPIESPQPRRKE